MTNSRTQQSPKYNQHNTVKSNTIDSSQQTSS